MQFRYTAHQVARGSRPDATRGDEDILVKNVALMRLTYQVRLLTFRAVERGTVLVLLLPRGARLSGELARFRQEHRGSLVIRRAS